MISFGFSAEETEKFGGIPASWQRQAPNIPLRKAEASLSKKQLHVKESLPAKEIFAIGLSPPCFFHQVKSWV